MWLALTLVNVDYISFNHPQISWTVLENFILSLVLSPQGCSKYFVLEAELCYLSAMYYKECTMLLTFPRVTT